MRSPHSFRSYALRLAAACVLAAPLAACQSVPGGSGGAVETEQLPDQAQAGAASVPANPAESTPDYADMTYQKTDGDVEIFDLDSGAPPVTVAAAPQGGEAESYLPASDARGVPYRADPSVTTYPLDQSALDLPGTEGMMPQMPPPSSVRNPYPSPFAGWGGDPQKIFFAHGSSAINGKGKDVIDMIARDAVAQGKQIRVEGHASGRTAAKTEKAAHMANLDVSMKRAANVSKALIGKGVPAPGIETSAFGDTRPPRLTEPGMDEESSERRVEIYTTN